MRPKRFCANGHDKDQVGFYVKYHKDRGPASGAYRDCRACRREAARALRNVLPQTAPRGASKWLWEDNAAEYRLLRELGMDPMEIASKVGLSWGAMERNLRRHVGRKAEW